MLDVPSSAPPFWAETGYEWALARLPKSRRGRIGLAVGSMSFVGAVLAALVLVPLFGDEVDEDRLEAFGYVGVFIASLAGTSFIVFPLPGMSAVSQALIVQQGALLNPLIVGVVGGTGMAIGEAGSYIAGAVGAEASGRSGFQVPGPMRPLFDRVQDG